MRVCDGRSYCTQLHLQVYFQEQHPLLHEKYQNINLKQCVQMLNNDHNYTS